jgi:transcriptional regulator with XRE-family HTH domain
VSYCTTASCLAHRRGIFIQLWPGSGAPYPWVHGDLSPCDGVPRATAEQAGEVCACGHERHPAAPGPIPHGRLANPRPCAECPCPDFAHAWQRRADSGTDRQHGTKARYVFGPDEHGGEGKGCRCAPCKQANRIYENNRERMRLYGQWRPYVDAGAAREHVRMLGRHGIGWKRAAQMAGVSTGAMSKLLYGGPGDRPPSRRIRPETEAAILGVKPSPDTLAASAPVDAAGTHRRVRALVALGWSQQRLSTRLGMERGNFFTLMERRDRVTAATARAVRALYDELWDQAPPESSHREKAAASRARNYARARGWAPPMAWDDDAIDDPQAVPAGWQRRARLGSAEIAAEGRELLALGLTRRQAAERLGVSLAALEMALRRNQEAA